MSRFDIFTGEPLGDAQPQYGQQQYDQDQQQNYNQQYGQAPPQYDYIQPQYNQAQMSRFDIFTGEPLGDAQQQYVQPQYDYTQQQYGQAQMSRFDIFTGELLGDAQQQYYQQQYSQAPQQYAPQHSQAPQQYVPQYSQAQQQYAPPQYDYTQQQYAQPQNAPQPYGQHAPPVVQSGSSLRMTAFIVNFIGLGILAIFTFGISLLWCIPLTILSYTIKDSPYKHIALGVGCIFVSGVGGILIICSGGENRAST